MKKTKKKDITGDQILAIGLLALGAAFSLVFILSICVAGQNIRRDGGLGSPNLLAAWVAGLLAVYGWFRSPPPVHRYRYAAIVILTILVTGAVIWMYGLSDAGFSLLSNKV